jgi:hypothetical protein
MRSWCPESSSTASSPGRLTPTEAGATAVIVTIIMGFFLKTLKLSDFPAMLLSSAKVVGVILPIIAFSLPLAQALAIMGVPQGFVAAVTSISEDPYILILLMIFILIAAGCVMETTPNIVILAPILKPLADNIGMNEIQFCIMMITSLGVGFITPPLGLNLFVVSGITGESILKIAWQRDPVRLLHAARVLIIAYVPALSTTLLPEIYRNRRTGDMSRTYLKKAVKTSTSTRFRDVRDTSSRSSTRSRRVARRRREATPRSSTGTTGNIKVTREEIEAAAASLPRSSRTISLRP